MAALRSRCGHYIFVLWFLLSSFFFLLFLFPRLISAVAEWMSTILLHMVWQYEFRMQVWNVLHAACRKYRTIKIAKNSPSGHHRTTLSGYIFATKARIDNRKKMVNSNISRTRPHNMVNFGILADEVVLLVWGTSANFNGSLVLTALLRGTLVFLFFHWLATS